MVLLTDLTVTNVITPFSVELPGKLINLKQSPENNATAIMTASQKRANAIINTNVL